MDNDHETEAYILLLLSDANLPTGSFVASAGLESFIKHGFFNGPGSTISPFPESEASPPKLTTATINFIRDSIHSYARSSLPFVRGVYEAMGKADALDQITKLDALYESMTLNHVARRASKAQGVALLTLYSKGFAEPAWMPSPSRDTIAAALIEEFKTRIRAGKSPGHLPICWAVLSRKLGLSRERSQHLSIFLHARALLSASVRLNNIGPYAAQQLLLHVVKPVVEEAVKACKDLTINFYDGSGRDAKINNDEEGPANTWPLGEILSSRHDLQHSRIFNS